MKDTTFERTMEHAGDLNEFEVSVMIDDWSLFSHNYVIEGRRVDIHHAFDGGERVRVFVRHQLKHETTIPRMQYGLTVDL